MTDLAPTPAAGAPLVLYDGVCGLCDRSVQWLLDHDTHGRLQFAPLQGETAAQIRARHPELPEGLDSILLVENPHSSDGRERIVWHSHAIFRILGHLPPPWRGLRWLSLIPRPLTDLAYRFVARVRYRIWGTLDACRLPSPEEAARFLP